MMDFHWHLQWLEIYLALSEQQLVSITSSKNYSSAGEILLQLKEGNLDAYLWILQHPDERVRIHGVHTFLAFLKECDPLQRLGILKALQATSPSRYLPAFQDLQGRWEEESKSGYASQNMKTPFSSTCYKVPLSPGCICWMSIESFWMLKLLSCFPFTQIDP